jgi:hypothetical protein
MPQDLLTYSVKGLSCWADFAAKNNVEVPQEVGSEAHSPYLALHGSPMHGALGRARLNLQHGCGVPNWRPAGRHIVRASPLPCFLQAFAAWRVLPYCMTRSYVLIAAWPLGIVFQMLTGNASPGAGSCTPTLLTYVQNRAGQRCAAVPAAKHLQRSRAPTSWLVSCCRGRSTPSCMPPHLPR